MGALDGDMMDGVAEMIAEGDVARRLRGDGQPVVAQLLPVERQRGKAQQMQADVYGGPIGVARLVADRVAGHAGRRSGAGIGAKDKECVVCT